MEKRYQVFVSSTYSDLQEERAEVMQALLELDCMPAGMELFPAANDEQWEWIKKIIDASDYYILIVAGRYGSISEKTGLSYTEMEYRYAIETNKPVIGFLHEDPSKIASGKTETNPESVTKLEDFRGLVKKKLCKFYSNPSDLGAKASRSLTQLIKQYPAVGWVRANYFSEDNAREILALKRQIEELQEKLRRAGSEEPEGIEELSKDEDVFEVSYRFETKLPKTGKNNTVYWVKGEEHTDKILTTWNEIFMRIAPELIVPQAVRDIRWRINNFITNKISKKFEEHFEGQKLEGVNILTKDFDVIKVQLRALKMIAITEDGGEWVLTPYGDSYMTKLMAIRKVQPAPRPA